MDSQYEKVIPSIITPNYSSKVAEILPIVGNGSVNQIFIVKTERDPVVLRLNNDRGLDEFIKEKWCILQASALGVPGPEILEVGEKDGVSFMVQSYLEGTIGKDINGDKTDIWREMGKFAKDIHSIPVTGVGLKLIDPSQNKFADSWDEFLNYNINSLNSEDRLIELGALTSEQVKKTRALFEKLSQTQFKFGLNHGDLSLKNTMVSPSGKVSLFDWGSAEASVVPHFDFGETIKSSVPDNSLEFAALLEGYGITKDEYQQIASDVHALMYMRAVDKLRWAIDRSPNNIPEFIETVKRFYNLNFN
jgi:aminoglycoside phosphotransferase (APT) family kinase protein